MLEFREDELLQQQLQQQQLQQEPEQQQPELQEPEQQEPELQEPEQQELQEELELQQIIPVTPPHSPPEYEVQAILRRRRDRTRQRTIPDRMEDYEYLIRLEIFCFQFNSGISKF